MDLFELLLWVSVAMLVYGFFLSVMRNRANSQAANAAQSGPSSSNSQMAEDIKAIKTGRVADQIEILDDLGKTSENYRQYCELVGTSMRESGVIAPYSGREVAYYDVKCYRIDYIGTQTRETLVAHETSIDPFYFKDDSCDTPVYVDIKSFGNNIILVNSTNHVEGPNSDFSKAFQKNSSPSGGASGTVTAFAALDQARLGNVIATRLADWLRDARRVLTGPIFRPQYALAGAYGPVYADAEDEVASNVMFANVKGLGGHGPGRRIQGRPSININIGGAPNMGSFLSGGGIYGMPGYNYGYHESDMGSVLVGMTLSALLRSMNEASRPRPVQQSSQRPSNSFGGYRIVEDVVPLGSPVYCIGELYRQGTDVYMGRAVSSKEYNTSFFATRPEAEVLSALGA